MAQLKDKIENALNETRILVLGIQMFIGFDFKSFFEPGYSKMAPYAQQIQLLAAGLLVLFHGAWFGYSFWTKRHLCDKQLSASHLDERKAA